MCLFAEDQELIYALHTMYDEGLAHQFAELYMFAHDLYLQFQWGTAVNLIDACLTYHQYLGVEGHHVELGHLHAPIRGDIPRV